MKPEELRIGNYVDSAGLFVQISAYMLNYFQSWDFSPIPLTEEWLKNFRFTGPVNGWFDDPKKILTIGQNEKERWIVMDFYDYWEMPLKYVHQLQNLFFALTGEELQNEMA